MTARRDESDFVVLDLRDEVCDIAQVEGSVLVLDHAEKAVEHDQVYQALLGSPQVSAVICLAVDGGDLDGNVSVRPAPSLAPAERAATVWIGHQHGIRWRPSETRVRIVKPAVPSGLRQLIDALAEPAVFDAVVTCVSTLPYSTASAGLAVERTSLRRAELLRVQEEAVTQFTDQDAGQAAARELPRDEFRAAVRATVEVDSAEDVLVPDAELAAARARAIGALNAADHEITRLDHRLAPFPKHRPGRVVGGVVEEARAAARDFHEKVTRQLLRIDENLRGQRVTNEVVTQLGVRAPAPARPRGIRDQVRYLVEEWLGRYRSIAQLLPDLDTARIAQEPQGCPAAIAELATLAPPADPAPLFQTWPAPLIVGPLAALTGVLAVAGVAPEIVAWGLVLAWFAAGLLLHTRQPTATGELGLVAALAPAAQRWALPVFGGLLLAVLTGAPQAPDPWNVGLTLLAVLIFVATAALSWRRGVRRWRRALGLGELRSRVARTDQLLDEVVRGVWRPSAQRALLAEALRQVSIGLTAIREVLTGRANDLFATPGQHGDSGSVSAGEEPPPPDRDVYQEVREVVVTDLVDLTIAALRPCWTGIVAARPVGPTEHARETERLLTAYHGHVERHGLLAPPPFARERADRATLATRLWANSDVTHALERGVEDEMTQLCHAGQLGAVSAMAGGAQLVRFAPVAVRGQTWDPTGPGPAATWTGDAEIAGTLRFVPLRQGVFQ